MRGRLVVCPTPIGNLEDVTLRVLRVLGEADVIACEDTRHTRKLLDRHGIGGARLVSYHEHNERRRAAELAGRGSSPARSSRWSPTRARPRCRTPGSCSCASAWREDWTSRCCPGPSAVVTALVASALPVDRWRFAGFLPRKAGELRAELERGEETLVAFESPGRLPKTLALLAEMDPERAGRGVPGADQAARGGGARPGARGRGAVRGGGAGRDRAGDRARRGGGGRRSAGRGRRSRRWSRRAPGGGPRRGSSRG